MDSLYEYYMEIIHSILIIGTHNIATMNNNYYRINGSNIINNSNIYLKMIIAGG